MPTRPQIIALQQARRSLGLNEQQYRTLLRNVARVDSSKQLDNRSFEDVMATLEDMGARHPKGEHYWREKVRQRRAAAGDRTVHKIHALARSIPYPVHGLCLRHSNQRTAKPEQLAPDEAYKVVEALKAIAEREGRSKADRSNVKSDANPQQPRRPECVPVTDEEVPF